MRFAVVILIIITVGCTAPAPSISGEVGILEVTVLAGPICPVETQPPDPACEPRPVAGAQLFVSPGDGTDIVVSQATTDENGFAQFELPAGTYIVTGSEVAGFFGIPDPAMADVLVRETARLTLSYDTGIR
ncbi:MAG: prealbumin-like fold domain-containing protein [Candidatus Limnocylindria bacterium]